MLNVFNTTRFTYIFYTRLTLIKNTHIKHVYLHICLTHVKHMFNMCGLKHILFTCIDRDMQDLTLQHSYWYYMY